MSYLLSTFKTLHFLFTETIEPVGFIPFLPLALFQTLYQTFQFHFLNAISYFRLFLIYNYNLLHILQESENDQNTFKSSYHQKRFNNKTKLRRISTQVDVAQQDIFDVVEKLFDLASIWSKSVQRAHFLYNKWVVHFPINFLQGDFRNSTYKWNPTDSHDLKEQLDYANNDTNDGLNEEPLPQSPLSSTSFFTPKPFVITDSQKTKNAEQSERSVRTNLNCPVIGSISREALGSSPETNKNKIESFNSHNTEQNKDVIKSFSTNGKDFKDKVNQISYKIKIRKRGKNYKNHPTYGNYELLAQEIRNIIPQPGYQPDGTIGPNIIRFTWHCCGHYDRVTGTGGSSGGTMRFAQEFNDIGNTGLNTAKSYLDQVHENFPWISFADLYTYAGCVAIEYIGGPKIPWKPGRTDCPDAAKVPPIGRLPNAVKDSNHVKEVFYNRLGFNAQETVALIGGGHGIGGCHARFSGFNGIWTKAPFTWDNDFFKVLLESEWKIGVVPETGIEQYYNEDKSLMMLNTDMEMLRCPDFRKWVEIFAHDEEFFNKVFADAFAKLLELGVIRDADGIQRVKV